MATYEDGTRDCKGCGRRLPLDRFWFENKAKGIRHYRCSDCHGNYIRDWIDANGDKRRDAVQRYYHRHENRFKKYGLTRESYDQIASSQNHCCLICGDSGEGRWLHIDHCHASGKYRGLVCSQCNTAIGKLRDSPENAMRVARYLMAFQRREIP